MITAYKVLNSNGDYTGEVVVQYDEDILEEIYFPLSENTFMSLSLDSLISFRPMWNYINRQNIEYAGLAISNEIIFHPDIKLH